MSNYLILCRPLLLLVSVFPSIKVFSNESALHIRYPKYWSFSVSPSSEYSRLTNVSIDWFDALTVQGSQESSPSPQFKSINSLVLNLPYGPTLTSIHDYQKTISSVQSLSHLQLFAPHGLQHTRLPCSSPTPRACSYSCPLSRWCHPTISSSLIPFSCLQTSQASGSFPVSRVFRSGSQSIGASASVSVLPMNTQDCSPLGWTGWISLLSKGLSRVFSSTTVQKHQFFGAQLYSPTLPSIRDYWKNHSLD